jgi:Protein of unknown function (DUF3537)
VQDFVEVFGEQTVVEGVLKEHLDIRKQLKIISHRFRGFIVACLLIVTASQFTSVLLTTRKDSADDLLNTGELAVIFSPSPSLPPFQTRVSAYIYVTLHFWLGHFEKRM